MKSSLSKMGPAIVCGALSNNTYTLALVQCKREKIYIHDVRSHSFKYDVMHKGHIFNMVLVGDHLQKTLCEFSIQLPYISLAISDQLHGGLDEMRIEASKLLQYQLLMVKVNKSCIALTYEVHCLMQLANYLGIEIKNCDSDAALQSFLLNSLEPLASDILISSHDINTSLKMMLGGLYLLSIYPDI